MLDSMVLDDNSAYFRIDFYICYYTHPWTDPERGRGGVWTPPPEKLQKYRVS